MNWPSTETTFFHSKRRNWFLFFGDLFRLRTHKKNRTQIMNDASLFYLSFPLFVIRDKSIHFIQFSRSDQKRFQQHQPIHWMWTNKKSARPLSKPMISSFLFLILCSTEMKRKKKTKVNHVHILFPWTIFDSSGILFVWFGLVFSRFEQRHAINNGNKGNTVRFRLRRRARLNQVLGSRFRKLCPN